MHYLSVTLLIVGLANFVGCSAGGPSAENAPVAKIKAGETQTSAEGVRPSEAVDPNRQLVFKVRGLT